MIARASVSKAWSTGAGRRILVVGVAALFLVTAILAVDVGASGILTAKKTVTVDVTSTSTSTTTITTTTTVVKTSSETPTLSGEFVFPEEDCLTGIPQNATTIFARQAYNNTYGTSVQYSNGVQAFFPAIGCPQPVPMQYLQRATLVVTNDTFIAMENGSAYYFAGLGETLTLPGGQIATALKFDNYSNQTVNPCGSGVSMRVLAEIQAFFYPATANSAPILTNPQFTYVPEGSSATC